MNTQNLDKRMKALFEAELRNDEYKGYNHNLFRAHVRYEAAQPGPPARVSFLLTVTEPLCNKSNGLHGGCAATLIDVTTTGLLIATSRPGMFSTGGTSRTLNLKFVRPVPRGTEVRIVNEIVHVGKRLGLVRAEIRRVDTGEVCVVGEHDKVNTDGDGNGGGARL
ncbi:hypothetical protein AJ79_03983 [Helicocarpus griseus UAMH5409]|uniref:Thioesterase domain-containing protein n=1 Tax=Helicocarpus griseus UAMH5409 TaxID=1447875 RepID=A0A2B7XVR7_9EURO|nr:hypothetical protein AJ79_03983 [Helicocarpus griseus UAMH5409]